jgi:3,4-dihydroxy 2-butanone 4-phosphate synthase / GTP cyclohydrolase II
MSISTISEIINDFKCGKFVIMTDDENRENEGDLMIAAEFATAEKINFMAKHARGLICLALTEQQVNQLKLPMMISAEHQKGKTETAFTVSIEAKHGVTSGISASDRSTTIRTAINSKSQPADLICPGHIFPLRAQNNGVLSRAGHTEASIDLSKLAKLNPSAVICEVMNDDGSMARGSDLLQFANSHQIKVGTISDLIQYRMSLLPT